MKFLSFFNNSPKRQFFEHVLDKFELETKKDKIQGLCRTRWVERHTCFETFYELYVHVCCTFEAIMNPAAFPDKGLDDCWNWDSETKSKAQGFCMH